MVKFHGISLQKDSLKMYVRHVMIILLDMIMVGHILHSVGLQ